VVALPLKPAGLNVNVKVLPNCDGGHFTAWTMSVLCIAPPAPPAPPVTR
jgi:hypothetical protein